MTRKIDPKNKKELLDPHIPPGPEAPGILNKVVNHVRKLLRKIFK